MSAAPQPPGRARKERALVRLQGHCELVGRMTAVDERRTAVRLRLEQELGPEFTQRLLAGLDSATA
jgi:hypothetical protein